MTTLPSLQARVRAATGADRELDARLAHLDGLNMTFCDFDTGCYHGDCESPGCGEPLGLHDERQSYPSDWREDERLPRYTASINAALALVERLLPGWRFDQIVQQSDCWRAFLSNVFVIENTKDFQRHYARLHTLELTMIDALLSALIAREGRE